MSNQTNFQKVDTFNKVFGLPTFNTPQVNIVKEDTKLTKLRLDLIKEEVKELEDAIEQNNFVEIIDALADILYVTYGAGSSFGINLDDAYSLVHESNMTKTCQSEQEAKDTVEWYKKNEKRYDSPAYRQSKCKKYWIVYNESTGKILKSINYKPVDLSVLLSK